MVTEKEDEIPTTASHTHTEGLNNERKHARRSQKTQKDSLIESNHLCIKAETSLKQGSSNNTLHGMNESRF